MDLRTSTFHVYAPITLVSSATIRVDSIRDSVNAANREPCGYVSSTCASSRTVPSWAACALCSCSSFVWAAWPTPTDAMILSSVGELESVLKVEVKSRHGGPCVEVSEVAAWACMLI